MDLNLNGKKNINVLLIDDFVGIGASMNVVAGKIKDLYPAVKNIYGFAISGNYTKNFEIIKNL